MLSVFFINTECNSQTVTVSGDINGYDYVDLALPSGIKWATYNIGSSKPSEYGDYFAWGNTERKCENNSDVYKWFNEDSSTYTKYTIGCESGVVVDNKTILETIDDAASIKWGSFWCTPTFNDFKELVEWCIWKKIENFNNTGVNGVVGESKINGNLIFFPATGFYGADKIVDVGISGTYWTASLSKATAFAYVFNIFDREDWNVDFRWVGLNIRAVSK